VLQTSEVPVAAAVPVSTAIQVRKKVHGRSKHAPSASHAAAAAPSPAKLPDFSEDIRWRCFGLASLPLAAMLFFTRYIKPSLVHEPILWGILGLILVLGMLPLLRPAMWRRLSEGQRTIVMLQGVFSAGLFGLLLAEWELMPTIEFIPYLAVVLAPVYVLFG